MTRFRDSCPATRTTAFQTAVNETVSNTNKIEVSVLFLTDLVDIQNRHGDGLYSRRIKVTCDTCRVRLLKAIPVKTVLNSVYFMVHNTL